MNKKISPKISKFNENSDTGSVFSENSSNIGNNSPNISSSAESTSVLVKSDEKSRKSSNNADISSTEGKNPNISSGKGKNPNILSGEGKNPNILSGEGKNSDISSAEGENTVVSDTNSINHNNSALSSEKAPNLFEKSLTLEDFFNEQSKNELNAQFPDVEIEKLRSSKEFSSLLGLIIQNPTLAQVYSCFNSICKSCEEKSKEKLVFALASAEAGVGSLSSRARNDDAFFTKEQVLQMSQEEIKRNYDKIRQSQRLW